MTLSQPAPKISVLLPIYNEKSIFLLASIESILRQTLDDFELLLLDDGSTDTSCLDIIHTYEEKDARVRVLRNQSNIGLTKTLNRGLKKARAEFIARQDSDDISTPDRFQKQFGFLKSHPKIVLCGSWADIIDESGKTIGHQRGDTNPKKIKKNLLSRNTFVHSSFFFRKSAILSVGGYSEEMRKAQDYDLLLKLAARFSIANIPEHLCQYRMNAQSITFKNNKDQEYYALLIRKKALQKYGYPKIGYIKLIRPLFFYYCIPPSLKKILMRLLWKI